VISLQFGISSRKIVFGFIVLSLSLIMLIACASAADASNSQHLPEVKKVQIRKDGKPVRSLHAQLGEPSIQLSALVRPVVADDRLIWESSDPSVAVVDNYGKVIMFGAGETVITAAAADGSGASDSVTLSVSLGGADPVSRGPVPKHNDGTQNDWEDFIGVTHINPQYSFGGSSLQEAGERLMELNTKSIKLYLSPNYRDYYQFDDWNGTHAESPAQLASSEHFSTVFQMDFNTYFIGAFSFTEPLYATYWRTEFTEEQKLAEYNQMYDLAYYLLTEYEGTGKTFILQNWEGDWSAMAAPDPSTDPSDDVFRRMTEWINIRQNAVNDARIAAQAEGVQVYHALEVNLVKKAMNGGKSVTNDVIPYTYCDYYSYSAYDTILDGPQVFADALDYLQSKADSNLLGGHSRLFVGEFGLPENEFGEQLVMNKVRMAVEISRAKQIDHVVYWQLYDNEVYSQLEEQTDENCRGYWLITPSGRKTAVWAYFYELTHDGASDPAYIPQVPDRDRYAMIDLGFQHQGDGMALAVLGDGTPVPVHIGGADAVATNPAEGLHHLYFDVENQVIPPEASHIKVEVNYFDSGSTGFVLRYNSADPNGLPLPAAKETPAVMFTNTQQWKTHTFTLSDAQFNNALYNLVDFYLASDNDTLIVNLVRVWIPDAGYEDAIRIVLGAVPVENGIELKPIAYDGAVLPVTIGGREAMSTDPDNPNNPDRANNNYMYFNADDGFVPETVRELYIEVTYYDRGTSPFRLQYNSTLPDDPPQYLGLITPMDWTRTGTDQWLTHTFHITNAEFANKLQGGLADFRLSDLGDKLYVSEIVIRKAPTLE
jgi:hypothetical protein